MRGSSKDRGYAWIVCCAAFIVLMVQSGLTYTMGYLYILFKKGLNSEDGALSLITSLNIGTAFAVCPIVGMLTERFDERRVGMAGGVIATAGMACCFMSTQVYQLCLGYGVFGGIGMGTVYNASMTILAKYFRRYRKVVCGFVACGTGVGSFILPPLIKLLDDTYGWRGTILMVAGIQAHMVVCCCLFRPVEDQESLTAEIEVVETNKKNIGSKVSLQDGRKASVKEDEEIVLNEECKPADPKAGSHNILEHSDNFMIKVMTLCKSIPFLCFCTHAIFIQSTFGIVYTHIGSYILFLGYTDNDVVYLYMTMGITTTIARALLGIVAEITNVNLIAVISICALINGVLTLCIPLTNHLNIMFGYVVFFCTLFAPFSTLDLAIISDLVPKDQVPSAFGIASFFRTPGNVFGPPVAALVYSLTGIYATSFYMAGGLSLLAGLVMAPALCKVSNFIK